MFLIFQCKIKRKDKNDFYYMNIFDHIYNEYKLNYLKSVCNNYISELLTLIKLCEKEFQRTNSEKVNIDEIILKDSGLRDEFTSKINKIGCSDIILESDHMNRKLVKFSILNYFEQQNYYQNFGNLLVK